MRAHNPLYCPKKSKITVIVYVTTICIHPGGFCYTQIVVWARGAHNTATESQLTVYDPFVHSESVSRNWFKYLYIV